MRKRRLLLRTFQLLVFLASTATIFLFASHFPNLPPILRQVIHKGAYSLESQGNAKVDARFLEWFNRDPEREIPTEPRVVVSPADGVVQQISRDQFANIVIEMRYTDVHVQRVPMDGKVVLIEGDGKPLPANTPIGSYISKKALPYKKVTTFETQIGTVLVHQITSFFAKRIAVYVKEGEAVHRGERLGRVLAGSTVVIQLPLAVKIAVKENQEVLAGETIIATY